jgi:hypothetical protein
MFTLGIEMINRIAARRSALFAATMLIGVAGCANADAPAPRSRSVQVAEHQTVELAPAVSSSASLPAR